MYQNTNEIKNAVLNKCGELTNGTSTYDSLVVDYINNMHQGLVAGGNEFGVEVSEAWPWAKARRPMVLTLLPPYETGTVTMTLSSYGGTFSSAPSYSVEGWYLKIESRDEWFIIRSHIAGASNFTIDIPYTEASGTFNFLVAKFEYELVDNSVHVTNYNNKIDFKESSGGGILTATLNTGFYSPTDFAVEVKTRLEAAGSEVYTISYNSYSRKTTISSAGSYFSLLFVTGTNKAFNASELFGMNCEDKTGALSYESDIALNAIQRLIAPMVCYRDENTTNANAEGVGKIFGVDYETFVRKYPLAKSLLAGTPTNFTVVEERSNGTIVIRFNNYVTTNTRVEIDYIPIARTLMDNTVSIPLLPLAFRDYLVFGASYYLLLDKSDNRADVNMQLAKAKLLALVNHNRDSNAKSGNNYGKLIARRDKIGRRYIEEAY